jgi:protein-tyrosine phosphatase
MIARTSRTHPLKIASLAAPGGGVIGITFCPGKHQTNAMTGAWSRDLDMDLDAIRAWGAEAVVTLITDYELYELEVTGLGAGVTVRGMRWFHMPIEDKSVPTEAWELAWLNAAPQLHAILDASRPVLVHCKGGLGRAGTVAARLLVERGLQSSEAIRRVRAVRPGAIETGAQEAYLLDAREEWEAR